MNQLEELQRFVTEANQTTSSNDKKKVIAKYPQCKKMWNYIYDSMAYTYGVTSKRVKSKPELTTEDTYISMEALLLDLNARVLTGHAAIAAINRFVADNVQYKNLIYGILDRNIKTRTDAKLINKIFPGCIPVFLVALAEKYEDGMNIDFDVEVWLESRKLDGVRCLGFVDAENNVTLKSRTGKPFKTLGVVGKVLKKMNTPNTVYDGELCLVDEKGVENFQEVMKYIQKKNFTIPNPRYKLFDMLTTEEFESEVGDRILSDRLSLIKDSIPEDQEVVVQLDQHVIRDEKHFQERMQVADKNGWEGNIIRKDIGYKGKRSKDMLKCKKFHETEKEVDSIATGMIRYIEDKVEYEEEMMTKVFITHKGNDVGVGSGWSREQRQYYFKHPEDLIGKIITIQYFEETLDETGKLSLRFPTIKWVHGDQRDT